MIVVTGGAGFIGSNIVKGLNQSGEKNILVVDDLKDSRKHINLNPLEIHDLFSPEQFLDNLNKLNDTNELLIPIGSGIYTKAKALKGSVLVDVGAGVMLKKTPEESKKGMAAKSKEVEILSTKLQEEMLTVIAKINEIGTELQKSMQGK